MKNLLFILAIVVLSSCDKNYYKVEVEYQTSDKKDTLEVTSRVGIHLEKGDLHTATIIRSGVRSFKILEQHKISK